MNIPPTDHASLHAMEAMFDPTKYHGARKGHLPASLANLGSAEWVPGK